jgi:NAD(P)-dependent dehydrogenase (short-subunit alcohol dehydrogenase family)
MGAQDPYSLAGKVAIIVGSASGIGRAIAREFARAGAGVACVDRDEPGARETTTSIIEAGGSAIAIRCDVSSETETKAVAGEVYRTLGRVDILVNGAAIREAGGTVVEYDLARWNLVYAVMVGARF